MRLAFPIGRSSRPALDMPGAPGPSRYGTRYARGSRDRGNASHGARGCKHLPEGGRVDGRDGTVGREQKQPRCRRQPRCRTLLLPDRGSHVHRSFKGLRDADRGAAQQRPVRCTLGSSRSSANRAGRRVGCEMADVRSRPRRGPEHALPAGRKARASTDGRRTVGFRACRSRHRAQRALAGCRFGTIRAVCQPLVAGVRRASARVPERRRSMPPLGVLLSLGREAFASSIPASTVFLADCPSHAKGRARR